MKKERAAFIVLMALMLAVGMLACGGGGGGGGGVGNVPALQSTTSIKNTDVDTDGQWFVWQGKSERVLMFDGTDVTDLTNDLEGLEVKELAFDGRYLAVRAVDMSKGYADTTVTGHVGIYYYDTNADSPPLRAIQLTDDQIQWVGDMAIDGGIVAWAVDGYAATDDGLYAYNIATGKGPVKISGTFSVDTTGAHAVVDGARVFWDDGTGIIYADVSSLGAFSPAGDITELSTTGYDVKVDGDVVVWEDGTNIYCYNLSDGYTTVVNLTAGLSNTARDPDVSGTNVVIESSHDGDYDIYIADVSDLAHFDDTLGSGDVKVLHDTDTQSENDPQIAGNFVAWQSGADPEVYATDLSAGLSTAIANIVQVSTGFNPSYDYHEEAEELTRQYYLVDSLGNVIWTEFDEEGDTSGWYEVAHHYNIADGSSADTSGLGYFVRMKETDLVDGVVTLLVQDAYDRIFARKAGGGAPIAVSPSWQKTMQPDVDDGIVAWSGKPGYECYYWEIYYADLNSGSSPVVHQVTASFTEDITDKKPAVDGDGGIILWRDDSNDYLYYQWIGEPMGISHFLADMGSSYDVEVDDGIVTWRDNSDVYFWNISDPADSITEISGSITPDRCPVIENGVIAFQEYLGYSNNRSLHDIYYYDTMDASPTLSRVTSAVNTFYMRMGLGDGVIAFAGRPAGSSTDTMFVYNLGDPVDSLTTVYQVTDTSYEIRCTEAEGNMVAFVAEVDGSNETDRELFTYRLGAAQPTRVTEDQVFQGGVKMGGGYVVYHVNPNGSNPGNVYAFQP